MAIRNLILILIIGSGIFYGCPPKTTEAVQETTTETNPHPATQVEEDEKLSDCPNFSDAPNPDQILEDFVLYRDFMKAKDWDGAYEKWQRVYKIAPAADGKRNTVFADGIRFYEHYYRENFSDSTKREEFIDKIYSLYDELEKCFPEGGYVSGRKAFDYFYKYPHRSTKEKTYELFKASIDTDGDDAQYFVLNPFTSLLVDMFFDEKISFEEAKRYEQIIRTRLARGLEECEGRECDLWKAIEEYAPARLEGFEGVKSFYGCDYYVDKYYPEFEENPDDCEIMLTVYSRLRFGDCPETNEKRMALETAYKSKCAKPGTPTCRSFLEESKYQEAIDCYEEKANSTDDMEKKGEYLLLIAKIYNAHLKKFSKARQYARKAAAARPNWGDPYLLIGRLYASSGPLCGPGRGWDSQIVVWPAIDMWRKAKRIDPNAAAEANKWIGRYTQYMPKKEDIFIRNLKEGDSFRVPCWIQETTIIRAAP